MAVTLSQVVAETGDHLIGLVPMLALTCKSFYKYRVLHALGSNQCCLKHVTRPADAHSRVIISNISVHVPALVESVGRLQAVRWEMELTDLREFVQGGAAWPAALKDVEVTVRAPIASGIEYLTGLGDFGPAKVHACFESVDRVGRRTTATLTAIKASKLGEAFGGCVDAHSVLRACLRAGAKDVCERARGCCHIGGGEYVFFDAFEGLTQFE
jgi:hypothetical protein